jgi:hypothetical protein
MAEIFTFPRLDGRTAAIGAEATPASAPRKRKLPKQQEPREYDDGGLPIIDPAGEEDPSFPKSPGTARRSLITIVASIWNPRPKKSFPATRSYTVTSRPARSKPSTT